MKLNEKKVRYIVRWKKRGKRSREIATELKVSRRRVNQIWKEYRKTGEIPEVGKRVGRPRKMITEEEKRIVKEAKARYKLGARMLEGIIERDYGIHIPHNRIHRILIEEGLAKEESKKKRRRKWIRYERKESLEAIHMDWHERENGEKTCIIEDDASRAILGGGEFEHASEKNSIAVFKNMMDVYGKIGRIKMLIIDNGSEFGAHRKDEMGNWSSEFKRVVESYGIKIVTSRVNHPQTNGKLERLNQTYEKVRDEFESFEELVEWYNTVRPHESLGWKCNDLETPEEAFWRKLSEESKLGIAARLFWW